MFYPPEDERLRLMDGLERILFYLPKDERLRLLINLILYFESCLLLLLKLRLLIYEFNGSLLFSFTIEVLVWMDYMSYNICTGHFHC